MEFQVYDISVLIKRRERRLSQIEQNMTRIRRNLTTAERYIRLFGRCFSEAKTYRINAHIADLKQALTETDATYSATLEAPLTTFA